MACEARAFLPEWNVTSFEVTFEQHVKKESLSTVAGRAGFFEAAVERPPKNDGPPDGLGGFFLRQCYLDG